MRRKHPFAAIPVNAEEHFRLLLLGQLLDLFERERAEGRLDDFLGQFGFLHSYADRIAALWSGGDLPRPRQWTAAVESWACGHELPFDRLASIVRGEAVRPALLMIAAIEEDPRLSLLVESDGGAPTLGGMTVFLCDICDGETTGSIRRQIFDLAAVGALVIGRREAPRIEWTLRLADAPFELLSGARPRRDGLRLMLSHDLPDAAGWIAPSDDCPGPAALGEILTRQGGATIILRGDSHNGRKTMLRMAARAAGRPVIELDPALLVDMGAWREANLIAELADALVLIELDPGPGERAGIPASPVVASRLAIVTSHSASIDHGRGELPVIPLTLPRPDPGSRQAHWQRAGVVEGSESLSERLLTSGHIHHAARSSSACVAGEGPQAIRATLADMRDPRLEATAQRMAFDHSLDALFLEDAEREEMDGLALLCRLREKLHGSSEAGVKALLTGPSGTGKTLAAKHLARDLGRPLYRIDLAATVNKYIGETEKNLERALAAAEELDVVLLLDEGDALLAKRTDVGSATDRYANMETNFLLQRLEVFRGIIVVTTNDGERIDRAFRRRMDAIVAFRLPDQLRRLDILQSQLGDHGVSEALLDEVACRCALSGGQLHNLVLHARLLALAGDSPLGNAHLVKAVQREYRKSGEHCPLRPALAEVG